jgi:hypothetical protein
LDAIEKFVIFSSVVSGVEGNIDNISVFVGFNV